MQAQTVLTADQLKYGQVVDLDELGWKYSPGDDRNFADTRFVDREWTTLADSRKPQGSPSGWHGIGWLRLHLQVAPQFSNIALNLEMAHFGASEVYVNGKLIRRYGVVGKTLVEETAYNPNAVPLAIVLQNSSEQLIAVRYSNQEVANAGSFLSRWLQTGEGPFGIHGIGIGSRIRELDPDSHQSRMGYCS